MTGGEAARVQPASPPRTPAFLHAHVTVLGRVDVAHGPGGGGGKAPRGRFAALAIPSI